MQQGFGACFEWECELTPRVSSQGWLALPSGVSNSELKPFKSC
jgi:hypothetical protein